MEADLTKHQNKVKNTYRRVLLAIVLMVAALVVGAISMIFIMHFISDSSNYNVTRAENDSLRAMAMELPSESGEYATVISMEILVEISPEPAVTQLSSFLSEMLEINPDYAGWISIGGTRINHPVVRGQDNDKYVNTSFYGEPNALGALFMDFRNRGEYLSNIIIYGHNSHQGEMFGDLHLLLNEQALEESNIITINVNGRICEYEIFSVRRTNVYDPAYTLEFDYPNAFNEFIYAIEAPANATQIITLSTCVSRGNSNERLVVQGYSLSDECIFSLLEQ